MEVCTEKEILWNSQFKYILVLMVEGIAVDLSVLTITITPFDIKLTPGTENRLSI